MAEPVGNRPMRALSITQPWATLIARGRKRIETRSWRTAYTGPLAIHASQGFPLWARSLCFDDVIYRALFDRTVMDDLRKGWDHASSVAALPRGAVIATARLTICEATDSARAEDILANVGTPDEWHFGDYSPGRWMWVLADAQQLPEPVPARGSLGMWDWTPPASLPLVIVSGGGGA
jgi:activating signal cointegrator 1